jgi:hypothetical protein
MKTIMGRGTGHLDIFREEGQDEREEEASLQLSHHVPSEAFTRFMAEGPLDEYVCKGWSPEKKLKDRKLEKELIKRSPSRDSQPTSRSASRGSPSKESREKLSQTSSISAPSALGAEAGGMLVLSVAEEKEGEGDGGGPDIAIGDGPGSGQGAVAARAGGGLACPPPGDGESVADSLSFTTEDG